MAFPDRELTQAEENERTKQALVKLAGEMAWGGCYKNSMPGILRGLAEAAGATSEEIEKAVADARPKGLAIPFTKKP